VAEQRPDRVSVPTLVVTGGPLDGTSYELPTTGDAVVGSSMDANVQILLGNVEPFHARVTIDATGALTIADAGSATGTFVNGERVEGEHPLREGDRICLGPPGAKGSAKMLVFLPGELDDTAAATTAASPRDFGLELGEAASGVFDGEATAVDVTAAEGEDIFSAPQAEPAPPVAAAEPEPMPAPASFAAPPVPSPSGGPAAPVYAAPPPPPPRARTEPAPPPPPPPPAAPKAATPPPPPSAAHAERLTAPAPVDRPASAPRAASEPEYSSELPAVPVPEDEDESSGSSSAAAPFPALRPRRSASGKGRPAARRRRALALPSLPLVPLLGAAAGLAVVGGLVWFFLLRTKPPELSAVAPAQVEAGQPVTLTGRNFGEDASKNVVLFGTQRGVVSAASPTEIKAVVPAGAPAQVPVVVETSGGRSAAVVLTVTAPVRAEAIVPAVAMPGQTILIRGEGFAGQQVTVQMGGLAATSVETSPEGVRAVVPALGLPEGSTTPVVVTVNGQPPRSFELLVGRLPLVRKLTPNTGAAGERVVVDGRGFAPAPASNAVTFGGQPALVLKAAESQLTVVVPAAPISDVQPDVPVVVTANGRTSSANASFRLSRTGTGTFVPRFYAAPVPEYPADGLAFVATELGPVLLLGGPAEASSTADRAVALADQLNAFAGAAASRPLAFEAREAPQAAVAVVGQVRPLLVVTPEDVDAHARPWDGRGTGRRVTPAQLARHWSAVLQDYLGLFLYRQRPLKVLAMSSRGKVLADLYSEAGRRSPGGTGIPASVVFPTSTTLARDLRMMALVVSTEGGRSAVAVEGRWNGVVQDPDLGDRPFSITLRSEGGRLAGTITTGQGAVQLTAPLRDVGFDRGNVRFTADLQGTSYRFRGTLEGNAVAGTIERAGRSPARFTLQYAE
jgi:hypothetical protein